MSASELNYFTMWPVVTYVWDNPYHPEPHKFVRVGYCCFEKYLYLTRFHLEPYGFAYPNFVLCSVDITLFNLSGVL